METHTSRLCLRMPQLQDALPDIGKAFDLCVSSFRRGGTLFVCGNGGSRADADHITGELMKGFLKTRRIPAEDDHLLRQRFGPEGDALARHLQGGLRTIVLGAGSALATAVSNDNDPELVYAQELYVLGRAGDVLLALSTSGNARNVAMACRVASLKGVHVIGMTGASGGALAGLANVCIRVPACETYLVQELHLPLYHCLCAMLEDAFFQS